MADNSAPARCTARVRARSNSIGTAHSPSIGSVVPGNRIMLTAAYSTVMTAADPNHKPWWAAVRHARLPASRHERSPPNGFADEQPLGGAYRLEQPRAQRLHKALLQRLDCHALRPVQQRARRLPYKQSEHRNQGRPQPKCAESGLDPSGKAARLAALADVDSGQL